MTREDKITPVGTWGTTGGLGVGDVEGRAETVVEGGVTTGVVASATKEVEAMTEAFCVMAGVLGVTTVVLASTSEGLDAMTEVLGVMTGTLGVKIEILGVMTGVLASTSEGLDAMTEVLGVITCVTTGIVGVTTGVLGATTVRVD